jgi:hypothetical protein
MASAGSEKEVEGKVTDAKDSFDRDLAGELLKQHSTFVNDALGRLVTLSASLAGGGVFLLTDYTLGPLFRAAVVLMLVALVCALKGMQSSVAATLSELSPQQVRQEAQRLLAAKTRWLQRSALALLFGLILAVTGMLLR